MGFEVGGQRVRLGVVGAGDIGKRHISAIAQSRNCTLSAVADPTGERFAVAESHGAAAYATLEEMLAQTRPDGVIIATPNSTHVPLAELALRHGVPSLVEKPISDDLAAAYHLADLSERTGVPVLAGHHRRHNPIVQGAREIVQCGGIGAVTAAQASFRVRKPDDYYQVPWRVQKGGGPILINLIHDIDNLRFIIGEVESVQASTSSSRRGNEVEDSAAVILRFRNGALGTIIVSDTTPSPWSWELTSGEQTSYVYPRQMEDAYTISGLAGSLAVPSLRMWTYAASQSWQEPLVERTHDVEVADPLLRQIEHFADVISGKATPIITARDAARTLEVTLAVHEAAASGMTVAISG